MPITKNANRLLRYVYKRYLVQIKNGKSRIEARTFAPDFYKNDSHLTMWHKSDVDEVLSALEISGYIQPIDLNGYFELLDVAIVEMENRPKNRLNKILSFIAKFIP